MKNSKMNIGEIADLVEGTVEGDPDLQVERIDAIDAADKNCITFAVDLRRASSLTSSAAAAAIVGAGEFDRGDKTLVRVENVEQAVAKLLDRLSPKEQPPRRGVSQSADIAEDATVAPDAAIGPGVSIGPRAKIGARATLHANVVIGADVEIGEDVVLLSGVVVCHHSVIGNRVRILPGAVIGGDGFGYYFAEGRHNKIPHAGNVIIEDDVELGANTCIDRGKFGPTRIGAGSKLDNLVQIGHGVQIGKHCVMAGQSGVAGSTKIGDYCVFGGGTRIRDNIKIGNGVQAAAQSAIAEDVPDGQIVGGIPAVPIRDALRIFKAQNKLPDLLKRVRTLESRLKEIESAEND